MNSLIRPARPAIFLILFAVLAGGVIGGYAQAMTTTIAVDGTIAAVHGGTITLTQADKMAKTIALQDKTLILGRQVVGLDQIKPGDAVGVASRRDSDGSMVAISINIFAPEMWDGVRKGQFPMTTGDTMTNAVVAQYAAGVKGRVVTMKYAEGTSAITVPDGTQIHKLVVATPAALTVGLHVTVRGTASPDGSIKASAISFDQPTKG
jgi:hypothetical protein